MCKLNLKLTAGPFGIYRRGTADERFWLGTKDFEIGKDRTVSVSMNYIIDMCIYQYEEEWINGAEKMFLTRFDKCVCAFS